MKILTTLSDYLSTRRAEILQAWHDAAYRDAEQTTVASLTRSQFNDHIPEVLDAFETQLRAEGAGSAAREAERETKRQEVKHGIQRWQQGYRLEEVTYEWGHLHFCLFEEIQRFRGLHPEFDGPHHERALRALMHLVNEGIAQSAAQYARMQQAEAAGQATDLQRAIMDLRNSERQRTHLIRQVVHDLRGNVQAVSTTAEALGEAESVAAERVELSALLQQGVEGVSSMLGELMELARLEAGQESVDLVAFDAGELLNDFCRVTLPMAQASGLYLRTEGPHSLLVRGDPVKARRILQNLVHNSLKYTVKGGVDVSWAAGKAGWWMKIKDTGPGMLAGPVAPVTVALETATETARETDEVARKTGDADGVLPPARTTPGEDRPAAGQPAGEGIGLSIVKRLCEMLDASIELTSSAQDGTTFRILFPQVLLPEEKG